MKIYRFLTISIVLSLFNTLNASSYNVAPKCRVTASSALNESYKADTSLLVNKCCKSRIKIEYK